MVRARGAVVGLVLIAILAVPGAQHLLEDSASRPAPTHALEPGQLRGLLRGFHLDRYEGFRGLGDSATDPAPTR